ncbi:MAG: protein kinase domain-containing protein [Candidatus Woesearchaeota archaeon]
MSDDFDDYKDRILQDIIEDIMRQDKFVFEGDNPYRSSSWRDEKLLIKVRRKADNLPLFMKIIPGDDGDKEAKTAYDIHKLIPDKEFIEPVIGDNPEIYHYNDMGSIVSCKAIVLERAKTTLKDHFRVLDTLSNSERERQLFDIVLRAGHGLRKLHMEGLIHKDVKESNIMLYPLGWGIGDYGISNISDAKRKNRATRTINSDFDYMPYELARIYPDNINGWYDINSTIDIFSLGAVLFKGISEGHQGLYAAFKEKYPKESDKKSYSAEFVFGAIQRLNISKETKAILSRMLAELPPIGDRYMAVEDFIADAKSGPDYKKRNTVIVSSSDSAKKKYDAKKDPDKKKNISNPQYSEFIKERDDFIRLMDREKINTDNSGLILDKSIDSIVTVYEALKKKFNTSGVKQSVKIQNSFYGELVEQYTALREEQRNILERIIDEADSDEDLLRPTEIVYIWGPPFTDPKRGPNEGKARYTYDETFHRETHYHSSFGLPKR